MPIYDLSCEHDHRFEVRQSYDAPLPDCPTCAAPTRKLPSRFSVSGGAALPPAHDQMPQTWRGTHGANREYMRHLRRTAEARQELESRNPELVTGDRRPVLAHEGRFEDAPLRVGDPLPAGLTAPTGGHSHGAGDHSHGPGGHVHDRPAKPAAGGDAGAKPTAP